MVSAPLKDSCRSDAGYVLERQELRREVSLPLPHSVGYHRIRVQSAAIERPGMVHGDECAGRSVDVDFVPILLFRKWAAGPSIGAANYGAAGVGRKSGNV